MSGFTFSTDAVQFVPGNDAHSIEALERSSPSTVNQSANLGVHAPLLDESCRGAVVGSVVGLTVVSMGGETLLTMASAPNAEVKTIKIAVQKAVPDSYVEKLVHEGDILHDMQTIEEVGIPNQAILQAVFGRMSARFEYETPSSWEHGRGRVNIEVAPGDLHGLEELRKKFPQPCELVEIDGGEILKIILDDAEGYYPQALEKQPEEAERLKSLLRCASSVMGFYHKHTSSAQWRCYDRISSLNALVSGHRVSIVKNRFAVPE